MTLLERIYEIPGDRARLRSMEGLRAYAALLVFFVHYMDPYIRHAFKVDPNTLALSSIEQPDLALAQWLFASHYGVDIFFVLSGFLICRLVSSPKFRLSSFIVNRLLRIYPAAIASLAIWAFTRIAIQGWYDWDIQQFVGNLLFLNAVPATGVVPYNTVTWSLFFELLFYAIFPLIRFGRDRSAPVRPGAVMLFGLLVCGALYLLGGNFVRFPMFFAGALMASVDEDRLKRAAAGIPLWAVLVAYAGSSVLFAETLSYRLFSPIFAVTATLLVLKTLYGTGLLAKLFSATPLRYLGNVSYSFYLTHGLGIELVMYRYHDTFASLPPLLYTFVTLFLCLILSTIVATILFVTVERPYFRRRHAHPVDLVSVSQHSPR
jgi:peptidoglycan/LPS O-acetylase OafA/YrhL